ncbi:hypothetical protein NEUTE1DRAFT_121112 [Neurospora tetrasperma FGSC 2508]|uniref:MARVEL domain-containing protein n=1 Tax=Neurospora tetrasperma (strain FGSC 2508 / ATCC MYA-4615 / P0657) TaxID=510951 RepID=F8MFP7_NEUT8|nr:uncharacterized protein NEUTE1DRAFT_121112 [Neurospora tetrasperma FGSC 2508]EGO59273.1 hypothetical protein NEUTE1DRAFT_121112 [Neurospora tetrasperma FGSC 2508]EGZ73394.1 hypothetical protein NEUTE2DRAFT_107904 [Neurospora tetrasperma FGSC 2509]
MTAAGPSSSTHVAQERTDNDGSTAMQGAPLLPHSVTKDKNGAVFQQQQAPVPFGYGTGTYQPLPLRIPGSEIAYSKKWHVVKLAFQTASLVCSAVIFGIGLALGVYGEQSEDYRWWEIDPVFAIDASAAGLAILWTVAEFLVLYASKGRRGIHPGAHVGVQLIIVLVASLGVSIGGVFVYEFTRDYYDEPVIPNLLTGLMRTLLAFSSILWIIHFFLFVRACVETHTVNATNKSRRITYVRVPVPVPMQMGQIPHNMVAGQHSIPDQQNMMYGGYYAPIAQQPSTVPQGSQQQPAVPLQGYQASTL